MSYWTPLQLFASSTVFVRCFAEGRSTSTALGGRAPEGIRALLSFKWVVRDEGLVTRKLNLPAITKIVSSRRSHLAAVRI